jgi:hypothetical protein
LQRVEPLPGEQLIMRLKPHPLAFWHLFAISGVLIILGFILRQLYFLVAGLKLPALLALPFLQQHNVINILILWSMSIGVAIAIGLVYVRLTPVLIFASIALVATVLTEYLKMPLETHSVILILSGLAGFLLTESYRRGHSYYITNLRLIMEKDFISYDSRQITYDRISDLALVQGLIGRILNYGTVVPVTLSGFGLGEDSAHAGIAAGTAGGKASVSMAVGLSASGGRAVQIPRGRTYHTLYGVPNPREAQQVIAQMIQKHISDA